jgi:hypothetical protein
VVDRAAREAVGLQSRQISGTMTTTTLRLPPRIARLPQLRQIVRGGLAARGAVGAGLAAKAGVVAAVFDWVLNGLDIGYEIGVEALTAGSIVFHCVWVPLSDGANVVAGAGGTL